MKIKNIVATLFFEKELAPRNYINQIEATFPERFNRPFNPQPIPNDAPAMIPRITMNSKDGLENLMISQINMQYNILFKEEITNIEAVIDQYKEDILTIYNAIKNQMNKNAYYFGISAIIEKDSEDPIGEIKNEYLSKLDDNTTELNIRYGIKEDNKYYVNYLINNSREVSANITLPHGTHEINMEILSTSKFKEVRHFIQKTIDVNDKLAFNEDENYRTSEKEITNVIEKLKEKLLEEGE